MTLRHCHVTCKCGEEFYSPLLESGIPKDAVCQRCIRKEVFKRAVAFLLDKPTTELLDLRVKYHVKKHREEMKLWLELTKGKDTRSSARSAKCNSEEE